MVNLGISGEGVCCLENSFAHFAENSCLDQTGNAAKHYLRMVDNQIWVWYGFAAAIHAAIIMYKARGS